MEKRRVRITNDRLNSYGSRVLTSGLDVKQYERNPVLLYMHERGNVIGYVKDLEKTDSEVTGELVFDEASELSIRCKKQWDFGSLKMVSAGLDIVELSDDPLLLLEGQTSPTVTKSKLYEVSLVDIGANDDAIVLKKDGQQITLGKDSACPLPLLAKKKEPLIQQNEEEMEMKSIAKQLGLAETASAEEISAKIETMKSETSELSNIKESRDRLELEMVTGMVSKAIEDGKLNPSKKEFFLTLGKELGHERLQELLDGMSVTKHASLNAMVNSTSGVQVQDGWSKYKKLSEVPCGEIMKLKTESPAEYSRLYKSEYGMDYEAR